MTSSIRSIVFRALVMACSAPALTACVLVSEAPDPGSITVGTSSGVVLPEGQLSGKAPPSQNFALSNWKLTLPSGEEVSAEALGKGYQLDGVFYTDRSTGGLVFRTPNLAGSTKNSQYARTELRQMLAPQGPADADANNWTSTVGGTLKARLRVDAVSTTGDADKVGRVVIGQIHGPSTEVVRLYFEKKPTDIKGRIYVGTDRVWSGSTNLSADLVPNNDGGGVALGETFNFEIRLKDLSLSVTLEPPAGANPVFTQRIDSGYAGKNLYFKTGVYNQNDTGAAEDFAQATFFRIEASNP